MTDQRPRRRQSWNRSQSESFGPIKQVGVAVAIGLPLFVIGVLMLVLLIVSLVEVTTTMWILAAGVLVVGLLAALSGRIL
jgi:uncharacterized membrane protein